MVEVEAVPQGYRQSLAHKPGNLEVKFRGLRRELSSCMISAMTAQKMLRKGCQGYLAYVVEIGKEGTTLDEIPVVREFPDVFPDDITGLPPEREVEFNIDLILGTEPIFIPPYRMAPKGLRELKAQLEEFMVYSDASRQGLGCVLMQNDRVIAYASRKLKKH